jgi:hypothetical protein
MGPNSMASFAQLPPPPVRPTPAIREPWIAPILARIAKTAGKIVKRQKRKRSSPMACRCATGNFLKKKYENNKSFSRLCLWQTI